MSEHDSYISLNKKAVFLSIGISLFLVAIKTYAWFITDSVSLLSSLLDSSLDIIVSVCNMMAIYYSAKPADEDHRFGHDAIEDIVGLVQAAFISAPAMFLIYEASHRIRDPQPILQADAGITVMAISMICAVIIVLYQRYIAKKTGSLVVKADLMHYLGDFLVNASIMVSLYLAAKPGWALADPVLAILIAIYIFYSAFGIGLRAFNNLMDRELPDNVRNEIITVLENDRNILGYHALKTRQSGSRRFIQVHLDFDEALSLKKAHDISVAVRTKILDKIGEAEIIIHEDPKTLA